MTRQVRAHKPFRSAPGLEVHHSFHFTFSYMIILKTALLSCYVILMLPMWFIQIQTVLLSESKLTTKVPLWAGTRRHGVNAAVTSSTTPSITTRGRTARCSVSHAAQSRELSANATFVMFFFFNGFLTRCFCGQQNKQPLLERSESRHAVHRLCRSRSCDREKQKQRKEIYNQKIWWVACKSSGLKVWLIMSSISSESAS